ncbi:hypothetical protein TNCV_1052831 [Trichonephila clavipes]|nr:hypothetical protein TNCV_1052831 [Trichonephila clavipes]
MQEGVEVLQIGLRALKLRMNCGFLRSLSVAHSWDILCTFNECRPSVGTKGYDHELVVGVSKARVLGPMTTRHVEELKHVKSVLAQSSHVGMVWKLGEGRASSGVVLVAGPWFRLTKSVTNSLRVDLKCVVRR